MNQPAATRAILLASMLFGCSAYASDINKCVAPSGSVTLTDEACPSGAETVKVISSPAQAVVQDVAPTQAIVTPQRFTIGRLPPRFLTVTGKVRPVRPMALDVATLRAARLNLHLLDNAAQTMRAQRLASLN
ncbi:MAG TPA: DUF4124 domain-containing protein [Telluria sp.]|jgi:hypothetical protein